LVKSHAEESLGANPGDAALNPADSVAMGIPASRSGKAPPPMRPGTFRALQHRSFRLLFAAFMINQTGFWISHISLQGLMVDLTNNDTRQNGLLFFALFVPAFFLAPLAGVAADRFDRKRIVLVCYGSVASACAALALFTAKGMMTPSLLLAICVAMGISFAFSGPANFAIAANSVPPEDLASAVSLQSAANNLTRVAGPLLAAPFVATGHFERSFLVYLIAAVTAGFLIAAMRITLYAPDEDESGIWARMRSGFIHARERKPALPALATVGVLSFFGVSHVVLLPAFAQDILGGKEFFVWLVAATGVGAMVGALRIGRSRRPLTLKRATVELAAYGATLALFATAQSVALALATQLIIGYFYFSIMTNLQTLLQQIVDESKRGRVMSLFQVAWGGLVPFGSLAMGFLAGPLGTPRTLLASAIACIVYGAIMTSLSGRWEASRSSSKLGT